MTRVAADTARGQPSGARRTVPAAMFGNFMLWPGPSLGTHRRRAETTSAGDLIETIIGHHVCRSPCGCR